MPSTKVYKHFNCHHDFGGVVKGQGIKAAGVCPTSQFDVTADSPLENEIRADDTAIYMANLTGARETTSITCGADVAKSLNNKYLLINSATVPYYVWFNVNSEGTDPGIADALLPQPLLAGKTGKAVALATGANATTVASAIAAVLNPLADLNAAGVGALLTVTDASGGAAVDASAGTTGWSAASFTVMIQGNATGPEWNKVAWSNWS